MHTIKNMIMMWTPDLEILTLINKVERNMYLERYKQSIYKAKHNTCLTLMKVCPGWCGSVDCVAACEPKGGWFYSQSGHMSGLWARSLVGGA